MQQIIFPDVFSNQLSKETIHSLSSCIHQENIEKGIQFLWEEDPLETVDIVLRGYVKVFHISTEGREQVLAILKEGDFINTVSALRLQTTNHAHAAALTKVTLGKIYIADFSQAIKEYSDFAILLMQDLAEKLNHTTNLITDLSLHSTRQRLIRFLLTNSTSPATVMGWTQEEMAAHIGTVREVVGRILGLFAREGLIRIERQRIILLDEKRLRSELEEMGNAT